MDPDEPAVAQEWREQMLRIVARGFYRELTKYGVQQEEILRVATNLLEEASTSATAPHSTGRAQRGLLRQHIVDRWRNEQRLSLDRVELEPFSLNHLPVLAKWLEAPEVAEHFIPPFPGGEQALGAYLNAAERDYYAIYHQGELAGVVGAENIDNSALKLEMRKLIGEPALRGRGVGARGAFLFLYHAFEIRGFHKVYLHTRDMNMRNVNLNSKLGFELEGLFLEDVLATDGRRDVVRMGLLRPIWRALFA